LKGDFTQTSGITLLGAFFNAFPGHKMQVRRVV
jgi:hypothetical protein